MIDAINWVPVEKDVFVAPRRKRIPFKIDLYQAIIKHVQLDKMGIEIGKHEPDVDWLYTVLFHLEPDHKYFHKDYE